MRKMTSVLFIVLLILVFPLSVKAQIPQAVAVEEVKKFLDEYVNRYMAMDLNGFMALFSKDAVENRMLPYADIQKIYQKHFDQSKSLQYNLKILTIQTYARSAFASGRYEVIQNPKRGRTKVYQGNIQFELVRENGSLKIRELNYGRDQK